MSSQGLSEHEMVVAEVCRLQWSKGLDEQALSEIVQAADFLHFDSKDIVHRAGDTLTAVYFVIRGRLWASIVDLFGKTVLERSLVRGSCFGLFSIAQPDQSIVTMTANEPTSLLKLSFDDLHALTGKHREFQMNLYRLAGDLVRQVVMVDRKREQPTIVGVFHQSPHSRPFTRKLVERLAQIEDGLCVVSDDLGWQPPAQVAFRPFIDNGRVMSEEDGRRQLREWSDRGRIILDATIDHDFEAVSRALRFADRVLWCVRPDDQQQATQLLERLKDQVAGWREKACLVWLLDTHEYIAPYAPNLTSLIDRTFTLSFGRAEENQGTLLYQGLERIVHFLRGVRIGIALGGGAARGMAHLGVLKSLEEHGVYVDMLAGTSAGAMTGAVYAYGLDVDYAIERFATDLHLPWIYRHMPGGGYWYLLYKYRRGLFDPMLRKYLGDAQLEQLVIPTYTITVDLVSGRPVVREAGDAVRSILESINVPGLANPILGEREALVDGGLVNNIPADVLVAKGCNFVIASSVTAKLEQEFSGICLGQSPNGTKRKRPSTLQVLMRGQIVQSVNMNAVGVQPADFVIEPDVTQFDLSAFQQTHELAAIGEQTTDVAISGIKQMLSKLDDKLFPAN